MKLNRERLGHDGANAASVMSSENNWETFLQGSCASGEKISKRGIATERIHEPVELSVKRQPSPAREVKANPNSAIRGYRSW